MEKLKVFEAFAGVGSQRMALRNLGIPHEVVAISEIDKYAIQSYNAIHGETLNLGDISKIDIDDIPNHDLFTYSFPCQDISITGLQKSLEQGTNTRSSLLWECKRIIETKKPKYLMLENVDNLISNKHLNYFLQWVSYLEKLGYNNYYKVLNSEHFGVPQCRKRVFMISILQKSNKTNFEMPCGINNNLDFNLYLEKNVDAKYYRKLTRYEKYNDLKYNEKSILKYIDNKSNPTMKSTGLIYTLTASGRNCGSNQYIVHLGRVLTPKESWRLMGFTDEDFNKAKFSGISNTQLYKQAGNSIVVNVLEEIFKVLFKDCINN